MADNVTTPVPGGTILAGDEIAGVLYPRTKIAWGVDGSSVDASATNPLPTTIDGSLKSSTATRTTVASGVASVTIVASNANRKGATIYNSDANALLLDLSGGTAAATRCQVRLTQYQTYEVSSGYTGLITGIWEADGSGSADVAEFT